MIIEYSLIMAILLFNLAMVAIALLRSKTGYLVRHSTMALVLLMLFGTVRLFLPLSFPQITMIIRSPDLLPRIESVLRADLWLWAGRLELQVVILLVWGIGSVRMFLQKIHLMRKVQRLCQFWLHRPVDNSYAVQIAQKLGLKRVRIVVSPDVKVPCAAGVFTPRIYLPDMEMPDDMLEMVLRHEYQHIKSCDILIKLFYNLLAIVFWWNPIVHVFQRDLKNLLELRCDAAVTKHMSVDELCTYMEAVVYVVKHSVACNGFAVEAPVATFVEADFDNVMEQRFQLLAGKNKKSTARQVISVAVVVVLFLASFLVIVQPAYFAPTDVVDEGRSGFKVDFDGSYILATIDGRYKLFIDGELVLEFEEISEELNLPIIKEEN